jgi:hypothetical protein
LTGTGNEPTDDPIGRIGVDVANATNEPTGTRENMTNEPIGDLIGRIGRIDQTGGDEANATNEPTDAHENMTNEPNGGQDPVRCIGQVR